MLTATAARSPSSAIHSRRDEMVISRPTMMTAAIAIQMRGSAKTSRTSAVATMSLSATGSRKAPNLDVCPRRRARKPSNQSVTAAIKKMTADASLAQVNGSMKRTTSTGIRTIRTSVRLLGIFQNTSMPVDRVANRLL